MAICGLKKTDNFRNFRELEILTIPSLHVYKTALIIRRHAELFIKAQHGVLINPDNESVKRYYYVEV